MKKDKKKIPGFIDYLAQHSKTPNYQKTQLAEFMGISRQALHYFLTLDRHLKLKHLRILQRFFEFTDNEFFNLLNRYLKQMDQNP